MIDREMNSAINADLKKLYKDNAEAFIKCWECCYNKSANSLCIFGIVDEESYDTENGILFICKEVREWEEKNWQSRFLSWLTTLATKHDKLEKADKTEHPLVWYNIGRWAKFIKNPDIDTKALLDEKTEALSGLKHIAFTNVNKVYGDSTSGEAFWKLAETNIAKLLLQEEIRILKPKIIVVCGKGLAEVIELKNILHNLGQSAKIVEMPHPSVRGSKENLLNLLKSNLES